MLPSTKYSTPGRIVLTACMPRMPLRMSPTTAAAIFREPFVPRSFKLFLLAARPSKWGTCEVGRVCKGGKGSVRACVRASIN